MKRWFVSLIFAVATAAAYALPSVSDVEAQVQQGHYSQAQTMMQEVVAAKPDSARAHYIFAEILAHNDQFKQAGEEAARAKALDPAVRFTDPARFQAFQQQLERENARSGAAPRVNGGGSLDRLGPAAATLPAAAAPVQRAGGVPGIVWLLVLAVFAYVVWRFVRRNPPAPAMGGMAMPAGSNGPVGNNPYGPGTPMGYGTTGSYGTGYGAPAYGPGVARPSVGGGLLGTGLAAAGGVAAGMMAERWLEREREPHTGNGWSDAGVGGAAAPAFDPDANALENRNVDFGNGGNDWDNGSNDGGSFDSGGSSDDGGW